ncbi:response regulator FixJ [Acidisoma cladoniae]|uniref:response regulator FixJ n=1 Tax=Acidisoma cladoniae TaxID=3040935 RepID=UPI00254AA1FD|nr:response regulator FixJ [Acidisoma sp. PAMC 29798]
MAIEPVVHLIDDDDAVRQSLAFLLTTAGLAVRVHESATAFLKMLPKAQPGCVVTDVRMPDVDGLELQRRLQAAGAKFPVIIMTGHGDVPLAVQAMKAGAIDFIEKPFDDERMISAIRAALDLHDKRGYRDAEIAETQARLGSLSAREREVLDGILRGQPNKVVAYDLGISPRTVEVHRANVMTKMRTSSLSELVRMALVAGLLPSG